MRGEGLSCDGWYFRGRAVQDSTVGGGKGKDGIGGGGRNKVPGDVVGKERGVEKSVIGDKGPDVAGRHETVLWLGEPGRIIDRGRYDG